MRDGAVAVVVVRVCVVVMVVLEGAPREAGTGWAEAARWVEAARWGTAPAGGARGGRRTADEWNLQRANTPAAATAGTHSHSTELPAGCQPA